MLGLGFLSQEAMQEMLRILDRLIKDHFERAEARVEKRKDEDYDEVMFSFCFCHSCIHPPLKYFSM